MQRKVTVRPIGGRQLLGIARHHAVVTDRTVEDGGTDIGCMSGELLLLAIGSCSTDVLLRFLNQKSVPGRNISVDVFFEQHDIAARRDRIVISINGDDDFLFTNAEEIKAAAVSGAVTSRLRLGSDIDVRIVRGGTK